ncbi:NAD-dependent epimerase/dehydratase family protein [Natrinema altunense]|uniref:NAD-dependent epimerase/dehydratase n=1 Tax=Natrinema altunense (strain JCM 12890 / CGMCC 1.3731 / AJ2) TaxID=1227494 RepID=L9ZL84_NATA2|nr:NAD(P)-dependent oxidoreductase [Natrinema altunense]ELY86317.1 NAD-dependent epimerase/dehydratase [Natrinema altunense JCM 12890]
MTAIAITGASGTVGREAIAAFPDDDHVLTCFSHSETDDLDTQPLEIRDREAFANALEGQDVLLHLAANPSPRAEWDEVRGPNVDGVYNAFEAAIEHDLQRVVFASSNHAVNMRNAVSGIRPESTVGRPAVVRPDDPADPDTYYGVTKVFGEALGSYYAKRHGLEVVNLRIGWLLTRDDLRRECRDRDGAGERYARAMWLSPDDCRRLLNAAVTATLGGSPLTAHGISANAERFLSLSETMRDLGYRPRDDAEAVLNDG